MNRCCSTSRCANCRYCGKSDCCCSYVHRCGNRFSKSLRSHLRAFRKGPDDSGCHPTRRPAGSAIRLRCRYFRSDSSGAAPNGVHAPSRAPMPAPNREDSTSRAPSPSRGPTRDRTTGCTTLRTRAGTRHSSRSSSPSCRSKTTTPTASSSRNTTDQAARPRFPTIRTSK